MSKILYMPCPDIFGVWANSGENAGLPEFKEGVSVFKFEFNAGETEAKYSICEDISAQREALKGLRRWMSAVCNYDGFAPANTRQIVTAKPGVAERQADGSFKVKEQGTIEFLT